MMLPLQSNSELRTLFGLYDSGYFPLTDLLEPLTAGFSGARVFRYSSSRGEMLLRLSPAKLPAIEALNHLIPFLEHVQRQGVDLTPVPIRTLGGNVFEMVQGRWGHLEPFVSGVPLELFPDSSVLSAVLEQLARWHLAAASFVPNSSTTGSLKPARADNSILLQQRLQLLQKCAAVGAAENLAGLVFRAGNFELLMQLRRFQECWRRLFPAVLQELQSSVQILLPVQPILRDVWREHILLLNGQMTGLIDPWAACTDSCLADLTRLLGSAAGNRADLWGSGLTAYHAVRPLSPVEWQLLEVFDKSNLLLSARRSLELCISDPPEQSQRRLQRLEEYLNRLETYDSFRIPKPLFEGNVSLEC